MLRPSPAPEAPRSPCRRRPPRSARYRTGSHDVNPSAHGRYSNGQQSGRYQRKRRTADGARQGRGACSMVHRVLGYRTRPDGMDVLSDRFAVKCRPPDCYCEFPAQMRARHHRYLGQHNCPVGQYPILAFSFIAMTAKFNSASASRNAAKQSQRTRLPVHAAFLSPIGRAR